MRIKTRSFEDWPAAVRRQLIRATLPDGSMRFCVRQKPSAKTFVAFEGKRVLGWLLVWPTTQGTFATAYVFKKYRCRQVARFLYHEALLHEHPLHVLAWDKSSHRLFDIVRELHPEWLIIHDWEPFRLKHGRLQEIGIDLPLQASA